MPERQIVTDIAVSQSGSYALQIDYVMEQVRAGIVKLPEALAGYAE
jgi:hypothetical protein